MRKKSEMPKEPRFTTIRLLMLLVAIKLGFFADFRDFLGDFEEVVNDDLTHLTQFGLLNKQGLGYTLSEKGEKLIKTVFSNKFKTNDLAMLFKGYFLERRKKHGKND